MSTDDIEKQVKYTEQKLILNIETMNNNASVKNKINLLPQWYNNIARQYSTVLPKWIDCRLNNVCELWDNKLDNCGLVRESQIDPISK